MSDLNLVTNRNEATPDFNPDDRFVKVGGTLANVEVTPNRRMERARVDLHIQPVTEVVRAGERQTAPEDFKNGIHLTFDYGEWDAAGKVAKGPKASDVWFEAIIEAFEAAGYDVSNLGKDLLSRIGDEVLFVEQTIERKNRDGDTYEVIKRDPETRKVLPPINVDEDGVFFDEDKDRWSDAAEFEKVTATYTNLLPVPADGVVETAGGDEDEAEAPATGMSARERAAALLEASEDYDAFKEAALADKVINGDNVVRNEIIVGDFKAAS